MALIRGSCFCYIITLNILFLILLGHRLAAVKAQKASDRYVQTKVSGFTDPNTRHLYRVVSYNVKTMAANSTIRSFVQVSRLKLNDSNLRPVNRPENVQTIKFNPVLVDFDLHCSPKFCYMVAITSRSKRNVELYAWQRTQFDLLSRRDSFAKPSEVRLFMINEEFYIAVAQEQLHLSQNKISQVSEESTRFIGNAILKFTKGNENKAKYHQFIRLPFNPKHVNYFTAINIDPKSSDGNRVHQTENHFLVFSNDLNWHMSRAAQTQTFLWQPLNGYFWPYRLPRGVIVQNSSKPVSSGFVVQFPQELPRTNLTLPSRDYTEATEMCFNQLQRLLSDRELHLRHLIETSQTIWRQPSSAPTADRSIGNKLRNITSQVIVHGNVTVLGSMIESPQVSLVGAQHLPPPILGPTPVIATNVLSKLMRSLSPANVNQKLKQANRKLNYIREKLTHTVLANSSNNTLTVFNGQIRFLGNVQAKEVILRGVANSDVHLNAIPFGQLEHELVSLSGSQIISPQVKFYGRVVADLLEIHGLINDKYRLVDAIDITSRQPQILETLNQISPRGLLEFYSIVAPEIRMLQNTTINEIRLDDFITRDNRTQLIYGQKIFKRLSMDRLDLEHQGVPLNNFNLTKIFRNAIHLREPANVQRVIRGGQVNFQKLIHANRLLIKNTINQHINLSLIIQDSVKTVDANVQQISGFKNFMNGVKINCIDTQGFLNGIKIDEVFNLNPLPPYARYGPSEQLITGKFRTHSFVDIKGNLTARLINNLDVSRLAIRRSYPGSRSSPQIVRGHKHFFRPLRVLENVTLLDLPQISELAAKKIPASYPLINNIDLKQISSGLEKQIQRPSLIYIDNLEIEGSIDLQNFDNSTVASKATFANLTYCPLDAIRSRLVLAGQEDQVLDFPIHVDTIRARSIQLDQGAFNGMSFPQDFVLRSKQNSELVYGNKIFEHLEVIPLTNSDQSIKIGSGANINNIDYFSIQTFMRHEAGHNSTGEQVFDTINVQGNIYAKRINGHYWPEDILLKSLGTVSGPPQSPSVHNRIYSPLVFLNSSFLDVIGQLVLRGPIKLYGRMNGINLTEFSSQSATYGDKDLNYNGRLLKNKLFLGGLSVHGELRSHGLIDGVNIDEVKQRVVTIGPRGKRIPITASKIFLSDAIARGPVSLFYIGDLPVEKYLSKIKFEPDGAIRVVGKKTITGALRINKNLYADCPINGIDYASLRSRAISLSYAPDKLRFNKTLTVEGDVFMDNLWVDEGNGTIDGIKLADIAPRSEQIQPIISQRDFSNNQFDYLTLSSPSNTQMMRRPILSIQYERGKPNNEHISLRNRPTRSVQMNDYVAQLRDQLITPNLLGFTAFNDLVVGFIDAPYQRLEGYQLPLSGPLHSDHLTDDLRSFVVLDQVDFAYNPVTYHLSAVMSRGATGVNTTSVQSSIGGRPHELLSILPVEHPNGAIFISDASNHALFLLVSQDYSITQGRGFICPLSHKIPQIAYSEWMEKSRVEDLPEVDSFAKFEYHGSTYALAVSRAVQRVHLLILRGFSGFQRISHVVVPMIDHVEVMLTGDEKPVIVIYQTNGSYRIMESVII